MLRHRVVAAHLEELPVFQPNRTHRASPQAAGVEGDDIFFEQQPERRPVADDDGGIAAGALGDVEPRHVPCGDILHFAFESEFHLALLRADAHPGEGVDDDAQAFVAGQALVPVVRCVAVHAREEGGVVVAAQGGFDFARQALGLRHAPLRQQPGVDEHEAALRGDDYATFLSRMYGNTPHNWDESLSGYKRLRVIVNAFTRMRICTQEGEMEFRFKGEVENIPAGYMPWFDIPKRASRDATVIVGHWSALGLLLKKNVIALDTGCLWGGPMSAIRLEDRQLFQVSCNN